MMGKIYIQTQILSYETVNVFILHGQYRLIDW